MRSLLDEIIDNHGSGSDIVSEQHDINAISTDGMTPAGGGGKPSQRLRAQAEAISRVGGWDAAEYGRSQAEQVARLMKAAEEAERFEATPEGAAQAEAEEQKALAEMRQRAINRAGLDTTGGRVALMVAGQAPWHKLGVNVAQAVNSRDALRLSGTDWRVKKQPLSYVNPITGQAVEVRDTFGIIREDSGAYLGTVGSRYKPFQNADGFAMLDAVLEQFGARYEVAWSLYGGRRVFMLVRLPEQAFTVGHRDQVEAYALFTNPHDGSGVAECFATSERAVCANTLRIARQKDAAKGLRIRHTGDLKARVREAQRALNITVREFETFAQDAEVLSHTQVPNIRHYASDVLDAVLEVTAAEAMKGANALAAALQVTEAERELAVKSFEKKIERRGEILEDILTRYESERCGMNGQRGTAWAALNAVTESADHGKLGGRFVGSEDAKRSRRFESILTGDADEAKQVAYRNALALAT